MVLDSAGGADRLVIYQQSRIYKIHRESRKNEELFQIVTENAADMIAFVDMNGRRLYNSPAYKRMLGYSPRSWARLRRLSRSIPTIASGSGSGAGSARERIGKRLKYRIKHKDGSWRVLESLASTIRDAKAKSPSW